MKTIEQAITEALEAHSERAGHPVGLIAHLEFKMFAIIASMALGVSSNTDLDEFRKQLEAGRRLYQCELFNAEVADTGEYVTGVRLTDAVGEAETWEAADVVLWAQGELDTQEVRGVR